MQITIKIINQAPPAAKANEETRTTAEPVINLTADEWSSRQTAITSKAA